jgi:hypothetical protein
VLDVKNKRTTAVKRAKKRVIFTRPRDESVEAYKEWILATLKVLNPDEKVDLTEEEWKRDADIFWGRRKKERKQKRAVRQRVNPLARKRT